MLDVLGGRKFLFGILLFAGGFSLVILNKVSGSDFLSFANLIGATYVVGNVGATVADKMKVGK